MSASRTRPPLLADAAKAFVNALEMAAQKLSSCDGSPAACKVYKTCFYRCLSACWVACPLAGWISKQEQRGQRWRVPLQHPIAHSHGGTEDVLLTHC